MSERIRTLVALVTAEAVSSTGTAMTFVALPWFVLSTSGSAPRTSIVLAVEILPMALFGIPSGTVVTRLGGRTMMLIADAVRAPLIVLVPVLYWSGDLTYGLLLVIVFLIGLFTAPYIASQRIIIPELFGDDEVTVSKASAAFGAAQHVPIVIGPAIAGVLVAWWGAPSLMVVDGVTYLFAFLCVLVFVHAGKRIATPDEDRGILAGVRYLSRDRLLGPVTLTVIVLDGAAGAIAVAVPLLAFTRYDRNPHVAGWLFAGFGIGAILGSVVAAKLLDRFMPLRVACAGVLLAVLPLWLVVFDISWPLAVAAVIACGFFIPWINAPAMGLLTTRPPVALRAKVLTAVLTASGIGSPIGRLLAGPIFTAHGNAGVWVFIAGGMSLGALLFVGAVVASRELKPQVAATIA
jgi:MFS family permease